MKEETAKNKFKCDICGKFISYKELNDQKIDIKYIPDSHFTSESIKYSHKNCKNERDNN